MVLTFAFVLAFCLLWVLTSSFLPIKHRLLQGQVTGRTISERHCLSKTRSPQRFSSIMSAASTSRDSELESLNLEIIQLKNDIKAIEHLLVLGNDTSSVTDDNVLFASIKKYQAMYRTLNDDRRYKALQKEEFSLRRKKINLIGKEITLIRKRPSQVIENIDEIVQSWWEALRQTELSDDSFLTLRKRLGCIRTRHDDIQMIYVRPSYASIFDLIHGDIAAGRRKLIVTGTPGIGKSTFLYYLMWRMLREVDSNFGIGGRFNFYIQISTRLVLQFKGNKVLELLGTDAISILRSDCKALVIVDMVESVEPMSCRGVTIILSAPNSKRYREFSKSDCSKFCMNPWSYNEIKTVWQKMYSQTLSKEAVENAFEICGGIPRFVLENNDIAKQEVDSAFDNLGNGISSIRQHFGSSQANEDKITYTMLHIYSPDYTMASAKLNFASSYVTQKLFENLKKEDMDAAITSINTNQLSYFKLSVGSIFERLAHKRICEHGISVFRRCPDSKRNVNKSDMRSYEQQQFGVGASTSTALGPLQFEPKFPVSFANLNDLSIPNDVACGQYCEPLAVNFESIDSFAIRNYEAFLFQLIVAKKHPIKAAGLEAFVDFVERKWPADKTRFTYHLVFVFPSSKKSSRTFTRQPILDAEGKILGILPDRLKPFLVNQWIAELEILNSVAKTFCQ